MTANSEPEISLPEKDYLAILDLILNLHSCLSRTELKTCFQTRFLPLIEAQAGNLHMMDFDKRKGETLKFHFSEIVGIPEKYHDAYLKSLHYHNSIPQIFLKSTRPIVASGVDISIEDYEKECQAFLDDHPEYAKDPDHPMLNAKQGMVTFDRPDCAVGVGVQRWRPHDQPFSFREIRIFELVRPHLIQAVKTVALSEFLKKYKALTEILAQAASPMALAGLKHRLLFCNEAFQSLFPVERGQPLPEALSAILQEEASQESHFLKAPSSSKRLHLVRHPKGVYRVETVELNTGEDPEGQCWFLRLKPAVEPYTKLILLLQGADLSLREMEVACFVRDGICDSEIAQRLFISLNTVKNHVKSLHKKLNVNSRGQLVALLSYR